MLELSPWVRQAEIRFRLNVSPQSAMLNDFDPRERKVLLIVLAILFLALLYFNSTETGLERPPGFLPGNSIELSPPTF
jgi:type II secretory pathway component PulM